MPFVVLLGLALAASVIGFWAQWRMHQERIDARPRWRAWGSHATTDALFHPEYFNAEGRRWRVVALTSWAILVAAAIVAFVFVA
jgi:hypothetical protein